MTVCNAFDNFIMSRRIHGLSEKTVGCYLSFVSPFITYVGHNRNIEELSRERINKYIEQLYVRDISKATLATYVRHVKVFLKWIEQEYELKLSAHKIYVPKTPKKVLHIYDDNETHEIFKAVKADKEWIVHRNRAIIALMYDSGLRQSEVCTLKRKDVSFTTGLIKVCGKGNKERVVPFGKLSRHFMTLFDKTCPYKGDTYFVSRHGEQMTCDSVKHFMHKLAKDLPFELSSHKLRHNFATNYCLDQYEKHGHVDIYRLMVLMGHEEIETTRRYLHFANQILASRTNISHLDKIDIWEN